MFNKTSVQLIGRTSVLLLVTNFWSLARTITKLKWRQSSQYFSCFSFTVACPTIAQPNNGIRIGNSNSVGSTLRFVCNTGYRLVGSNEIQCLSSGQCSPAPPYCTGKDLHTYRYNESNITSYLAKLVQPIVWADSYINSPSMN